MDEFPQEEIVKFQLCIICQTQNEDELVKRPNKNSYEKLFEVIQERSQYGDVKLTKVWSNLKNVSLEELGEQVTWHRKCYDKQNTQWYDKQSQIMVRKTTGRAKRFEAKIE